jgi:hypothetical protein
MVLAHYLYTPRGESSKGYRPRSSDRADHRGLPAKNGALRYVTPRPRFFQNPSFSRRIQQQADRHVGEAATPETFAGGP